MRSGLGRWACQWRAVGWQIALTLTDGREYDTGHDRTDDREGWRYGTREARFGTVLRGARS